MQVVTETLLTVPALDAGTGPLTSRPPRPVDLGGVGPALRTRRPARPRRGSWLKWHPHFDDGSEDGDCVM